MFDTNDWSDVEDTTETSHANFGNSKTSKKSRKKKRKSSLDTETVSKSSLVNLNDKVRKATTKLVKSKLKDKFLNSPSLTSSLLEKDSKQNIVNEKLNTKMGAIRNLSFTTKGSEHLKVENILNKGIKFSSESQFLKFLNQQPKKRKRSKKNKNSETSKKKKHSTPEIPNNDCENTPKHTTNTPNDSCKSDASNSKNKENQSNTHIGFDLDKLNKVLNNNTNANKLSNSDTQTNQSSHNEDSEAKKKLKSSRFRFLNEKLYTQSGGESYKMFKNDQDGMNTFKTYHEGYAEQVKKWPIDPLDSIISSIMKRNCETLIVADFGCGEARLAQALSSSCKKIHSFDLVALNDKITVCDFSRTPLANESVDIAVFCLSLMGTNLRDYIKEANRVLKIGGVLKIAEVESRFEGDTGVQEFIESVEKIGFGLKWKDLKKEYFNLFDFKKNKNNNKKKTPDFELKPCIYKKR